MVRLLDPVLRQLKSRLKNEAWFRDQYEHHCESLHTIDEVLQWFDLAGFEFIKINYKNNNLPNVESHTKNR